jgi:hypothetical protein
MLRRVTNVPRLPTDLILMMEAIYSSETFILLKFTRRHYLVDSILKNHNFFLFGNFLNPLRIKATAFHLSYIFKKGKSVPQFAVDEVAQGQCLLQRFCFLWQFSFRRTFHLYRLSACSSTIAPFLQWQNRGVNPIPPRTIKESSCSVTSSQNLSTDEQNKNPIFLLKLSQFSYWLMSIAFSLSQFLPTNKANSVAFSPQRTIPTERPTLVGET